ncbi:MAG: putative sugar O-methyltransferase [Lachnospiraceae bacterium]|nr:putative sugar O-methyltransferase [Lachnospiraceae bacterium]
MSDDNKYPMFCDIASENKMIFKTFRRNSIYNEILEHVTQEEGQKYLDIINNNKLVKFDEADWQNFCLNDLCGKPYMFPYEINGHITDISPTTMRYAKVLSDIITLFDTEKINKVAEIGIGYAGQCRMLMSYMKNIEKYSLYDLPEVLKLAKRYLNEVHDISKIEFIDGTNIQKEGKYDFVISNYAFSELVREVQDIYLKNVILKAKAGYITWNALSRDVLDGYSVEQLLEIIPGSSVIDEKPLTAPENCIIIWGNK